MATLTPGDLTETERALAGAVLAGTLLDLGDLEDLGDLGDLGDLEDLEDTEEREVRAEFVRQVMAGRFPWHGGERPDPRGLRLRGARIIGELDLSEVDSQLPLRLLDCHVDGAVRLTGGLLRAVDLSGLVATSVAAQEMTLERSLVLRDVRLRSDGLHAPIELGGSRLGGLLDLSGARLTSADGPAVQASNLHTGGGVFLNRGFRADGRGTLGTVRLPGAVLGGQLNMTGAVVRNPDGPALIADYLQTASNVMLNGDFRAEGRRDTGTVRLVGARIGGRLICEGGRARAAEPGDLALNLSQTAVAGDLLLPVSFADGPVDLNGLTYGGQARHADLTEWLDLLSTGTNYYASQPYFQLAAAHGSTGHERDVRRIHIAGRRICSGVVSSGSGAGSGTASPGRRWATATGRRWRCSG
ncbi:hypothetical protein [Qaidamihabitans albus]|uniref:hypothetical protein n=1 Tax=Qaidamihabitans albus TaxID=2795733 RepID=UPI0018F18C5F|nr:hypothetical protein [Qaidamihabitans albus]